MHMLPSYTCTCTYTYTHTWKHRCTYTCIQTCIYIHRNVHIHKYTRPCTYAYPYIYIHVHIHKNTCKCTLAYSFISCSKHGQVHSYYTYMRTRAHILVARTKIYQHEQVHSYYTYYIIIRICAHAHTSSALVLRLWVIFLEYWCFLCFLSMLFLYKSNKWCRTVRYATF